MPTDDYFEHIDFDDPSDVDEVLDNLIYHIKTGYFLRWEAVVRYEQGLRLTEKQRELLERLIGFDEAESDRILYINGIARPSEPWYELARRIAPHILREPFRTDEAMWWAMHEGWPELVEVLETHGQGLTLPEDVENPIEIFPLELRHRLWLQVCFDPLSGLGQREALTLEEEDQHFRAEWFIQRLREHKETMEYFELTLEQLTTKVIMPPKDEDIFVRMMMEQLGMDSSGAYLADYL